MIIIGDSLIPYEEIEVISSMKDIDNTKSNSTLIFSFDKNIMKYCMQNSLSYGVQVSLVEEVIYANSLGAKYILPTKQLLETSQKLAENYMFDSKIIATIESSNQIEVIALKYIDGVIYKQVIL